MSCNGDCGICRLCLAPPVPIMEKPMNDKSKNLAELANAVETLGSLIGPAEGRDAIHVAVLPVEAGETMYPAQRIRIVDGKATATGVGKAVGIVDPFLSGPVYEGQRFWLLLFPRTITSLRHVWSHPDFPDEIVPGTPAMPEAVADDPVARSKNWIDNFAGDLDLTVNQVMRGAELWAETAKGDRWGEYTYENGENYKGMSEERFAEFWRHYEVVTGRPLEEDVRRESFFTCSC